MGGLMMSIAFIVPIAAGALRWPWWVILVCGAVAVAGFFMANPGTFERVRARGGLPYIIGPSIVSNSAACAVLFGVGRLLSLI